MKLVVNCKHDPFDVFVGRGSIWGNPYSTLENSRAIWKVDTVEEALDKYGAYVLENSNLVWRIKYLEGKVLGCYCDPDPLCHAHILAALANTGYELPYEIR
jgi:hypothetical protein